MLLVSALVLNLIAAAIVLTVAIALFGLLRPLSALGARRARSLSQAQMEYAGGIGEAIRVAEDTQVFGAAAAQRERIGRLIDSARELFFRTWLIGRLVPNLYQSLIYLLIVVGLGGLYLAGAGHAASLGAVVLLLVRAGNNGQQAQTSYQGLRQSLPFIERLQAAEERYAQSAPLDGGALLARIESLAFERVSFAYRAERPVLCGDQLRDRGRRGDRDRRTLRRRQVHARADPAAAAPAGRRPLPRQRRPRRAVRAQRVEPARRLRLPGTAPRARHGGGEHPLLPRSRPRGDRTGRAPGAHPRRRGLPGRRDTTRSSARAPMRSPAASSSASASPVRSRRGRRCSCWTSPPPRSTPPPSG